MILYKEYRSTDTKIYLQALKLRNDILRKPIGKDISNQDLKIEENNTFFGAFDKDQLIGTISYYVKSPNVAYLTAFAVKESQQRMGIGTKLVNTLIASLKRKNFKQIIVDVRESAVSFYQKCGFIVVSGPFLNKELNILDFKMEYRI